MIHAARRYEVARVVARHVPYGLRVVRERRGARSSGEVPDFDSLVAATRHEMRALGICSARYNNVAAVCSCVSAREEKRGCGWQNSAANFISSSRCGSGRKQNGEMPDHFGNPPDNCEQIPLKNRLRR